LAATAQSQLSGLVPEKSAYRQLAFGPISSFRANAFIKSHRITARPEGISCKLSLFDMGRLLSALYLLTSLVLLWTGFTFFAEDYGVLNRINRNDVPSLVILDFTAPALFLLGSALSLWTKDQSNKARWITGAVVLITLVPLITREQGWKLFAETAGPLISAVFVLDSMVRKASAVVLIAAVTCGITQGQELIFAFERYWSFGGPISTFLTKITPLLLVTASGVGAIASLITTRKRALRQAKS